MKTYKVIGLMSGSSMDGVDIAYCHFTESNGQWSFKITHTETVPYNEKWRIRLSQLRRQNALTYVKTDVFYGHYLGGLVKDFISKNNLSDVDFIASHGHTVFHNPEIKITAQVGDGASLSAIAGLPVVNDFRRADVAKGGEGAPLVTIGDKVLFGEYDYCINLGGFANISGNDSSGNRVSFDISPCNIPLNRIARDLGKDYDENGQIAENGRVDYELLGSLNAVEYYKQPYPKSLNRDWINQEFWGIVRDFADLNAETKMRTMVDHIAVQIANAINLLSENNSNGKKVLLTGGGAFNNVLVEHIRTHSEAEIIIPENDIVNFKEALVFAFLGILRVQNQVNTLKAGTGASSDSIGGGLHGNFSGLI
ncbi:MAG: anhydro-N-acetylmuramic acid kinase [Bacteroidia bacterium]|nr:anhydro-N-acetylmuramic acid kinase [Bacteroidia bacterium]MCO5254896.1 anhydro-N-acetylmuramic acid kinase [Bacteroidota bacterium]